MKKIMPSVTYGSQNSGIIEASLSSMNEAKLNTIYLTRSDRGADGNQIATKVQFKKNMPLKILPSQASITTWGCPYANFAQYMFLDFETGTTIDNMYAITGIKHNLSPGKFTTSLTLSYGDIYSKYENAIDTIARELDNVKNEIENSDLFKVKTKDEQGKDIIRNVPSTGTQRQLKEPAATLVEDIIKYARDNSRFGHPYFTVVSGLRTKEYQEGLWKDALKKYGSAEKADDWVARPGTSKHETGLAFDFWFGYSIRSENVKKIKSHPSYKWFVENIAKGIYKDIIVPYNKEPWHWSIPEENVQKYLDLKEKQNKAENLVVQAEETTLDYQESDQESNMEESTKSKEEKKQPIVQAVKPASATEETPKTIKEPLSNQISKQKIIKTKVSTKKITDNAKTRKFIKDIDIALEEKIKVIIDVYPSSNPEVTNIVFQKVETSKNTINLEIIFPKNKTTSLEYDILDNPKIKKFYNSKIKEVSKLSKYDNFIFKIQENLVKNFISNNEDLYSLPRGFVSLKPGLSKQNINDFVTNLFDWDSFIKGAIESFLDITLSLTYNNEKESFENFNLRPVFSLNYNDMNNLKLYFKDNFDLQTFDANLIEAKNVKFIDYEFDETGENIIITYKPKGRIYDVIGDNGKSSLTIKSDGLINSLINDLNTIYFQEKGNYF